MVKRILFWECIALLIYLLVGYWWRPQSVSQAAAQVFKAIGGGIMDIATGFGDFFSNLGLGGLVVVALLSLLLGAIAVVNWLDRYKP